MCLWAVCLVLGGSTPGRGADWVVLPGIELKSEYLSNINNSPTFKESDYIFSARPNVAFSYNSEITKLEGKLALLGLAYMQNSGLDRINQYYWLDGSHKATPRLSLSLTTAFITDSTANQELITSGTVINRQSRTSIAVNPGLSYFLTERLSTSVGYGFYAVDYQSGNYNNNNTQSGNYNNYNTQFLTNGFDYLLNEKTTLLSRLTATYSKYKTGNTISALGPQIGFSHKYEEKWDVTFLGGLNVNRINTNVGVLSADNSTGFINVLQREQTSTSISPFISLGTNYRWETGSLRLNYSSNQSANAYGNQSLVNSFSLSANQSITSRLTFNIDPYFYTSKIDNVGSDYNSYYYGIRPGLSYKLTEKTTVGAYYAFSYRTVTGSNSYSYPINDVWLTLNYSYPLHYQH